MRLQVQNTMMPIGRVCCQIWIARRKVPEHVLFTSMVNIGDCIFYSRILMTAILKRHTV